MEDLLTGINRQLTETILNGEVNKDNFIETLKWAGESITKSKDTSLFDKWNKQFNTMEDDDFFDCMEVLWKYLHNAIDNLHEAPVDEYSVDLTNLQYIYDAYRYQQDKEKYTGKCDIVFNRDCDSLLDAIPTFVQGWAMHMHYVLNDYYRDTHNAYEPLLHKPSELKVKFE